MQGRSQQGRSQQDAGVKLKFANENYFLLKMRFP